MTVEPDANCTGADHERIHRAGSAWTDRGTACLVAGRPGAWEESVRSHRRAVLLMEALPVGENTGYLADLGAAWVNLGCALLAGGTGDSLEEARAALARAIGLLERLPIGDSPRFRHNLAAAWMNRADASARMDTAQGRLDALREYGRAIDLASGLPLDEKPSFRVLLGSCWINLGTLHQRMSASQEAVRAYDGALAALGNLPQTGHRLACHHAATAWTNRGEALLRCANAGGAEKAVDSARRALAQVEGRDLDRPADAKLSLRALRVVACGLESILRGGSAGADQVAELTDAAERGIDLAFACRDAAPEVFDPFIAWFFSFGSRVYGHYQPQFLAEYLEEVLRRCDPDRNPVLAAELRSVARQAAAGALEDLGRYRLLVHGTRQTELLMGAVHGLRGAAIHLTA
jgi:tetratricopeptide (TPR) repeat protein